MDDEKWMLEALQQAQQARQLQEVPVGAVVVLDGQIIGRGYNQPISTCDPTAHAEIIALREAAQTLGNYRLPGCHLYVTLEPCAMCAGAMVHSRIARLVFGAKEPRAGAIVSQTRQLEGQHLNHQVAVQGGICESTCSSILSEFFRARRLMTSVDTFKTSS